MSALPAPFVRGLSVLAIGAALVLSHITFAAAAAPKKTQLAPSLAAGDAIDVVSTGSIARERELADNCYFEVFKEGSKTGKVVTRRVQECD
jgi:hypothetical protein